MLLLAGHSIVAASQESPNIKYGKINAADLAKKSYEIDTSANAVVLYEMGSSRIRGSVKGNTINLQCWLQINKTTFQPSEYGRLREFFNQVVAKQNEQIVFKKKS